MFASISPPWIVPSLRSARIPSPLRRVIVRRYPVRRPGPLVSWHGATQQNDILISSQIKRDNNSGQPSPEPKSEQKSIQRPPALQVCSTIWYNAYWFHSTRQTGTVPYFELDATAIFPASYPLSQMVEAQPTSVPVWYTGESSLNMSPRLSDNLSMAWSDHQEKQALSWILVLALQQTGLLALFNPKHSVMEHWLWLTNKGVGWVQMQCAVNQSMVTCLTRLYPGLSKIEHPAPTDIKATTFNPEVEGVIPQVCHRLI